MTRLGGSLLQGIRVVLSRQVTKQEQLAYLRSGCHESERNNWIDTQFLQVQRNDEILNYILREEKYVF